ncbi:hypothetical protein Clacol_002506 [Clathrus columnatus]|uniref:Mediator of RNA polymerase II transcription subunit 22 n=1 Tax=Clathrus columnatus TaxID=1419009 RepID=A0AAV5A217_9AGAM|nr:hypothetical protein Clacol_002506 [Clathrus columnatus]
MAAPFQTDASRPFALPTANIGVRSYEPAPQVSSEEYLENVEEEWNRKVDAEVETLVDGMIDLVSIASIENKDKFQIALESFQAQCRTESMVRAASSLMSITYSLKLMLLLSDEAQVVQQQNEEIRSASTESNQYKEQVIHLLDDLLSQKTPNPSNGL